MAKDKLSPPPPPPRRVSDRRAKEKEALEQAHHPYLRWDY